MFQIKALPMSPFKDLFDLSDQDLAKHKATRQVVTTKPGFPCRVSLKDAEIGETVILINYFHQMHPTPYQSSHAIFVREKAVQAQCKPNELPNVLTSRLISIRAFSADHNMIGANVVEGDALKLAIIDAFEDHKVEYLHLHNAKPGCFAASVIRA